MTDLLQRARLARPTAGLWEAADLQWWSTRDPHPGDEDAAFWRDEDGTPVTAAVFTRWGPNVYGCDVLGAATPVAWDFVTARAAERADADLDMEVDPGLEEAAVAAGFSTVTGTYETCWLDAADRPDRRTPARPGAARRR